MNRLGAILLTLCCAATAGAQDVIVRGLDGTEGRLSWAPGVSELPTADFTGLWSFDARASDAMVEMWATRDVVYEISQQPNRIVLVFRPENGETTTQEYRWDGSVRAFERGGAQVRERARWVEGGRTLEVEGRRWQPDDRETITSYTLRYRLDPNRVLVFEQIDDYGTTTWRFRR